MTDDTTMACRFLGGPRDGTAQKCPLNKMYETGFPPVIIFPLKAGSKYGQVKYTHEGSGRYEYAGTKLND